MTVSTAETHSSSAVQLPKIPSAFSLFRWPIAMDASGAPLDAHSAANAETSRIIGRQTPSPVSASVPTSGM